MQDQITQSENTEALAEKAARFGKFDNAETLLDAYNALEAEFTKRCQLVSKLQTELNALRAAQAESTKEEVFPSSGEVIVAIERDPDLVAVLAEIPEVCDACIAKYKRRLLSRPIPSPHGAAVIAPPKRPRTLGEAKALADEILKST